MRVFHVPEMSCGHCKATIETALLQADPGAAVEVDLGERRVRVTGSKPADEVLAVMKSAGYEATELA